MSGDGYGSQHGKGAVEVLVVAGEVARNGPTP